MIDPEAKYERAAGRVCELHALQSDIQTRLARALEELNNAKRALDLLGVRDNVE